MKLSAYIFLVGMMLSPLVHRGQSGPNPGAYELSISVGSSLEQVLAILSEKYDLEFSYPSEIVKIQLDQQRSLKNYTLSGLLNELFSSLEIGFQIQENRRILLRKVHSPASRKEYLHLTGKITDEDPSIPLSHAMIYVVEDSKLGTLTGPDGGFSLRIPKRHSEGLVAVRLLGYETQYLSISEFLKNPTLSLKNKPFLLSEIPIEEKVPTLSFQTENLHLHVRPNGEASPSDLLGNDAMRGLQLLPGISSDNDLSAGVRIRGSGEDETLIVLDGIPIYRAEHFFGVFSSINSQYVSEIQLYKNALPVEYGGRTGGMVLFRSDSEVEKLGSKIDINALTASVRLDIPLNSRSGIILQGRSTYSNAAESKIFDFLGEQNTFQISNIDHFARQKVVDIDPTFRFYDMNGKIFYRPTEEQYIDLNFFHSNDRLDNTFSESYETRQNSSPVSNDETLTQTNQWTNTGFSVNYRNNFAPDWQVKSRLFFTEYFNTNSVVASFFQSSDHTPINWNMHNEFDNGITDVGGEISFSYAIGEESTLQLGTGVTQHQVTYSANQEDHYPITVPDEATDAIELQLFGNYKLSGKDWRANIGGRFTRYNLTEEFYFSPRVTFSYFLSSEWSLKASFNQDYQFVRELFHESQMGQGVEFLILADGKDNTYPVGRVNNYMVGTTFSQANWSFDIEFFNKDLNNIFENALSVPGFSPLGGSSCKGTCDYRLFHGSGRSLGMDFIFTYEDEIYSGWVAYTLSKSTQSFPEIRRGEDFPTVDDRRHQLKLTNVLTLGNFQLTGNYILSSGRPYTNIGALHQVVERRHLSPEDRISRLPEYQRIDLGLNYTFRIQGLKASAGISVFNVANHQNIKDILFTYSVPAKDQTLRSEVLGTRTNMLNRTVNVSFKLDI
ncbi:MAG: TonB-dependent receptor plug domain-containing protein [Bacteroidota bacterium]